jgi:hypothetical protein
VGCGVAGAILRLRGDRRERFADVHPVHNVLPQHRYLQNKHGDPDPHATACRDRRGGATAAASIATVFPLLYGTAIKSRYSGMGETLKQRGPASGCNHGEECDA